jgi:hypothetical protein
MKKVRSFEIREAAFDISSSIAVLSRLSPYFFTLMCQGNGQSGFHRVVPVF